MVSARLTNSEHTLSEHRKLESRTFQGLYKCDIRAKTVENVLILNIVRQPKFDPVCLWGLQI